MANNNNRGWMSPFGPAIPPSHVDTPDSVPLLDLNPFSDSAAIETPNHEQVQNQSPTQPHPNQPDPFRVIIVGASLTGLILAHSLHRAGIEYTLLERSPTIPDHSDSGTGVLIWPDSARVLDQLGLLRETARLACPVRKRQTFLAGGGNPRQAPNRDKCDIFAGAKLDHGRPCMLVSRDALLRLLRSLPPGRVRTGAEVISVETHVGGVRVVCADESVEEGAVVVGCDGAHGVVRQILCELRAEGKMAARWRRMFGLGHRAGNVSGRADRTMEARYYGLVGSAPLLEGLEAGVCYETRGDATGKTFQVFTSDDTAHFLVYIPLHRPTNRQITYPAQNADRLASALADHPITENLKFSDLWRSRRFGKMVDFYEGMTKKWYHERIVLAGAAAHSMMPVLGLGVNTGWQGAVELANGLRRLLPPPSPHLSGSSPGTASIKRVFKAYQAGREAHARMAAMISSCYIRVIAHQSTLTRLCSWAAPGFVGDVVILDKQVAWAIRHGVVLDFLEEKHFKEGRLTWVNPQRKLNTTSAEERGGETVWVFPGIPIRVSAD